jgi:hypothetical protein
LGKREFQVEYFFTISSKKDFLPKMSLLKEWLYTKKPQPLVLPEETDREYLAQVVGSTEVQVQRNIVRGTITFLCEPIATCRKEKKVRIQGQQNSVVENAGDVEAFPTLRLTFPKEIAQFTIQTATDWMSFGSPLPVDAKKALLKRKLALYDDGTSSSGWTSGVGIDDGVITGELESTGGYLQPLGKQYGEGARWHGPAGVKIWDHGLNDFTLEATIGFKSIYIYQIGRIEIYLLDENKVRIGKVALRDAHVAMHNPAIEARVGPLSGGVTFVKKELGRGKGNDFYGRVTLKRTADAWRVELAKLDGKGAGKKWVFQTVRKGGSFPVYGLQIHFGSYGTYQPYSTAYIQNIRVYEESASSPVISTPSGFEPGDELIIDSLTGTICKNGAPYYESLDPHSSCIRLPKGKTKITFSPKGVTGEISFKERYL